MIHKTKMLNKSQFLLENIGIAFFGICLMTFVVSHRGLQIPERIIYSDHNSSCTYLEDTICDTVPKCWSTILQTMNKSNDFTAVQFMDDWEKKALDNMDMTTRALFGNSDFRFVFFFEVATIMVGLFLCFYQKNSYRNVYGLATICTGNILQPITILSLLIFNRQDHYTTDMSTLIYSITVFYFLLTFVNLVQFIYCCFTSDKRDTFDVSMPSPSDLINIGYDLVPQTKLIASRSSLDKMLLIKYILLCVMLFIIFVPLLSIVSSSCANRGDIRLYINNITDDCSYAQLDDDNCNNMFECARKVYENVDKNISVVLVSSDTDNCSSGLNWELLNTGEFVTFKYIILITIVVIFLVYKQKTKYFSQIVTTFVQIYYNLLFWIAFISFVADPQIHDTLSHAPIFLCWSALLLPVILWGITFVGLGQWFDVHKQ